MITIDSANDQNTMCRVRLHLHINDQNTHERRNLKVPYLHCYNIKIVKSGGQRLELEKNVQFGKFRKLLEH